MINFEIELYLRLNNFKLSLLAMQCDPYCSNYDACISPCPLDTCDNVLDQAKEQRMCQDDSCVEGCRIKPCQDGYIYKNDSFTECVPESVCRPICLELNGVVYYEGDIMESDSCHTCRCSRGKSVCIGEPCRVGRLEETVTHAPPPPPGLLGQFAPPGSGYPPVSGYLPASGYPPQQFDSVMCREGWSTWLNVDRHDVTEQHEIKTKTRPKSLKIGDSEPIPNFQQLANAVNNTAYCEPKFIQVIECRTVLTHQNYKITGQDVECSLEKGLLCSGPCNDYEIRVLCVCNDIVAVPSTPSSVFSPPVAQSQALPQILIPVVPEIKTDATIAPPPEFCDMSVPHVEYPGDCFKFKQCFLTGRGSEYVVKTCGPNMMYHPIIMVCDWPASVIAIKPDCGLLEKTATTFSPIQTTTPRVSNILLAAGLKEDLPCDLILEKPILDYPGDCHKYQECAPSPKGGYRYITKTCGEHMMFNPTNNICDWPTTVKLIKPECDGTVRQPESITHAPVAPLAAPTTKPPPAGVSSGCEPGFIWSDCALPCGRACDYYGKYLRITGHCDSTSSYCVAGCVETDSALACPPGYLWRDRKGCVKQVDCTCMSRSGKVVRPGEVISESECEVCQCIDNVYLCDTMDCAEEEIGRSLDEEHLVLDKTSKTTTIKLPPGVTTATPLITKSVVTPPPKCDPARFIPLIEGSNPLPDTAITASSTSGQYYKPQYARLHSRPSIESSGAWSPADNNVNEFIQVEFARPLPIYGVVLKGSPTFNSFVTSYNVMYSIDGIVYHIITDGSKQVVFSGPIDPRNPVQQIFPNPIEAKTIRVIPLTWNENIAIRLEFLGCAKEIPTTTPMPTDYPLFEIPTTMLPYVEEEEIEPLCIDPMGLDNGKLEPNQVKVSSTKPMKLKTPKKLKPYDMLQLSSPKGWSPILNTPNEFVIVSFDFIFYFQLFIQIV